MTTGRCIPSLSRRVFACALGAFSLAACVSVDLPGSDVVNRQYVLTDVGTANSGAAKSGAERAGAAAKADALLLQADVGDPIADSLSIAYARRAGERATYQLATWTDRPSRRVTQLLQRRLAARGSFGAVALLGQPVTADWLLAIAIDDIHHDVANEPGRARLAVRATLFDRRDRRQLAQRSFAQDVPTVQANSAAAAEAMNQALANVFDALVPWLEQEIDRARNAPRS